jgi:hypothetical protein
MSIAKYNYMNLNTPDVNLFLKRVCDKLYDKIKMIIL